MSSMADPSFDYDELQQLFSISSASNAVGMKKGTSEKLESIMQEALEKGLPSIGSKGDWKVVWGPAVFKKDPSNANTGPVNAWYVAQSESLNTYVVSVAGTSALNCDAIMEDIDIVTVVDFDDWVRQWTASNVPTPHAMAWDGTTNKPLISNGTSYFTYNVLKTPSPASGASPGTLLSEFLSRNASDRRLVFTGHSMGAAVAPTLALGLVQADLVNNAEIQVLPSAGATPGNQAFADQFASTFKTGKPYNTNYYNTLDIVPQAFNMDTNDDRHFTHIKEIYKETTGGAENLLNFTYNFVLNKIKKSMPYAHLQGASFTGDPIPPINTADDLRATLTTEHTRMYWTEFKIVDFVDYFQKLLEDLGLRDVTLGTINSSSEA